MSSKTEDQLLDDLTDFLGPKAEQASNAPTGRIEVVGMPSKTRTLTTVAKPFMPKGDGLGGEFVSVRKESSPCNRFLLIASPIIALCLLMLAAMALNILLGLIIYPLSLLWNPAPSDGVKFAFGLGVPAALLLIYFRCRAAHKA